MPDRSVDGTSAPARIRVVGVGGGGCNAVRRMMTKGIPGIEYVVANTDIKSLESVPGATSVQIGAHLTHGFGAGGDPRVGERSAEEGILALKKSLKNAELVFITAGMGGGTGTGAAPVVAQIAKSSGALTVAVVTTPFSFEGKKRLELAMAGVRRLKAEVDNLVVVHNDRLLQLANHDAAVREAFDTADEVVTEGILSVSQLVNVPGEINVDLADVRAVMSIPGTALMAIGLGAGQHGAAEAAKSAIANPLLDISMRGAKGVLYSFSGGPDLTLEAVNEASSLICQEADPEALIFFGMMRPNPEMDGNVRLTLIATGIKSPMGSGSGDGLLSSIGRNLGNIAQGRNGHGTAWGDQVLKNNGQHLPTR